MGYAFYRSGSAGYGEDCGAIRRNKHKYNMAQGLMFSMRLFFFGLHGLQGIVCVTSGIGVGFRLPYVWETQR